MMKNDNMSIGFIGAGRVGFTLGRYFYEKNLPLSGYFSHTYAHAREAAEFTHSKSYETIKELAEESEIIFITVPDSCIYDVYLQLREYGLKDKILCHCSGALSAKVFEDIQSVGAYGYSVHPAFAVSDKKHSYEEMSKAFFTIEGDGEKMQDVKMLLHRTGNPYQIISSDDKCKYHLALAMASNLVVALYHIALRQLKECGFSDFTAEKTLNTLFLNNADNIVNTGCADALTGPVERNDLSTVEKHLSVLDDEMILQIYKLLSAELTDVAKRKYPDRDYSKLENLLETGSYQ